MTLKKRGLGRGLEALLTDMLVKVESHQDGGQRDTAWAERESRAAFQTISEQPEPSSVATSFDAKPSAATAMATPLQRDISDLLQEAEALKELIEDVERIIRAD